MRTDQLLGADAVAAGPWQVVVSHGRDMGRGPAAAAEPRGLAGSPQGTGANGRDAVSGSLGRAEKLRVLEAMDKQQVQQCTQCPLCKSRTHTVFGEGDPDAQVMFIGEGPGQREDEQGRPFVGRAGEMLNKQITAMGLTRPEVYIANVVKCRPPNNRAPAASETEACWPYLLGQIATIRPTVIVTLGGPATKLLLNTPKGITAVRGVWHSFDRVATGMDAIPVMPTFHPAYLLRAYTPENRKKVWSDLQRVVRFMKEGVR